jgi:diaminohydroxyphosphoribosylaminopyrimidine deaminase/5-amino-6-(5-phosphoribosylamino)uracil reductase
LAKVGTKQGKPHAEVKQYIRLRTKSLLSKSSLFMSLEPCGHFGKKTPPCSDLIIANKIPNDLSDHRPPNEKSLEKYQKL